MPAIFSGYPGESPALVALVADDVDSVGLDLGRGVRSIPIRNNSVYVDLTGLTPTSEVLLFARFVDGSTRTLHLPNPRRE